MEAELQTPRPLISLPQRPRGSHSKNFRSMQLTTNHYKVELAPFENIFIFSVKFNPSIAFDNRVLRVQLLNQAMPEIQNVITKPVISGMNIYSIAPPAIAEFAVKLDSHEIKLKQVKVIKFKENPKLLLNFLNNGLRNIMTRLKYVEIGKSGKYFNLTDQTKIDDLILYGGFKSSFVLLENGFYLRVDSAKKVVRNQTALEAIDQVVRIHSDKERDERRNIIKNSMVGCTVMTNYGASKYYRVIDVDFSDIETTMLEGTETSVFQYFKDKYGITIKKLKQPMLEVQNKKDKKKILLIPELCLMTGIPENFDEFKRKSISNATIMQPDKKMADINKLINTIKDSDELKSLKEIGIKINHRMETFSGKVIPAPRLALGGESSVQEGKECFFNLFNKPIFAAKHSIKCGVISSQNADLRQLLDVMQNTSRNLKADFSCTVFKSDEQDNRRVLKSYEALISKAIQKEGCNVVLVVLQNNNKQNYKKIKEVTLLHQKILCQVMTENTLRKKNLQSIATKILLQIIAKRGNTLWVPKPSTKYNETMLVGYETAKASGNKTCLSLCATINSTFSSVFSSNQVYESNTDKFKCMVSLLLKAVNNYIDRNKNPPKETIILMNSCSGDQISILLQNFTEPLVKALNDVYHENAPNLSVIMVNVKTSERFFVEGSGGVKNVPSGALISEKVVSNEYDFYLMSQHTTRGSALPNHYKVIYSSSKIEEGLLQELIHAQCFNYVNWTGAIKVPGILQYAKKCAKFNAEVLDTQQMVEDLENKLYFV